MPLFQEILVFGVFGCFLLGLIPVFAVTSLKHNWIYLAAGVVSCGAAWFLGALVEAKPGSPWARQRHPGRKEPSVRERKAHRKRQAVILVSSALAAVLAVGLFSARPTPILGVDAVSLENSVGPPLFESHTGCSKLGDGAWGCRRYNDGSSGNIVYRTKVGWDGCWTAVAMNRSSASEPRISGCVTVFSHRLSNIQIFD